MLHEPRHRVFKEDKGTFIAEPRAGIEPADEPKMPRLVVKIMVAVVLTNLTRMLPLSILTFEIAIEGVGRCPVC